MGPQAATDRRRVLRVVRDGIARRLTPVLEPHGLRMVRRDAAYRREQNGVGSQLALRISSRPASLGGSGILVEPGLTIWVPAWMAEAERRLEGEADGWTRATAAPSFAVWELLDWLVPGKRPHWTLPDVPTDRQIDALAEVLGGSITDVAIPYFARLGTPEDVLEAAQSGEVRLAAEARFTVACGALLNGRPDLASALIAPIGTHTRQRLARVLGLPET
jgi:hypothetical protein